MSIFEYSTRGVRKRPPVSAKSRLEETFELYFKTGQRKLSNLYIAYTDESQYFAAKGRELHGYVSCNARLISYTMLKGD